MEESEDVIHNDNYIPVSENAKLKHVSNVLFIVGDSYFSPLTFYELPAYISLTLGNLSQLSYRFQLSFLDTLLFMTHLKTPHKFMPLIATLFSA